MALIDNLAVLYEFEADGSDATANAFNLTNNGIATIVAGKVGNATNLASVLTQYWSHADSALVEPGDADFSIAGWFNLGTKTVARAIVGKYTTTGNQRSYQVTFDSTADRIQFILSPDGTVAAAITLSASSFGSPSLATWYFFHAGYDAAANQMSISINDGTVDTASETGGAFSGTAIFTIGAIGNPTNYWSGQIDQIGVWIGRKLSAGEITQLYNSGNGLSYADMVGGGHPASKRAGGVQYMRLPGRGW